MARRMMACAVAALTAGCLLAREAPSVEGVWGDLIGHQKTKVTLNRRSKTDSMTVYDTFTFHHDGSFETTDGTWGTWTQTGTAYVVALDHAVMQEFMQRYFELGAPAGMTITSTLTAATLDGKVNGSGTRLSTRLAMSGDLKVTYGSVTYTGTFSSRTSGKGPRSAPGPVKGAAGAAPDAGPLLDAALAGVLQAVADAVHAAEAGR